MIKTSLKTKKIFKTVSVVATIISIAIITSCSTVKTHKPTTLLWEVRQKTDTNKVIYLLGSIHIGNKEIYPLNPIITNAWNKSDALGVEVNINNISERDYGMDIVSKFVSFTGDNTINKQLPPELYKKLKNKLISIKIPEKMIDFLTPLGATLVIELGDIIESMKGMLGVKDDDKNNKNMVDGIDMYFLKLAAASGKNIVELESFNRQIKVFEELNEFIIDYLANLLEKNEQEPDKENVSELFNAWKTGDVNAIEKLVSSSYSTNPEIDRKIKEILLYKRNSEISKKIEQYILENKTYFIVIGAGHFVGEKSIIDNLEKTGKYNIKRL